jgi:LysM repeat protein
MRATTSGSSGRSYTVKSGDNLTHIAKRQGVGLKALKSANKQIKDPNRIYPGQKLTLPAPNPYRRGAAQPPPAGTNGGLSNTARRSAIESSTGLLRRGTQGAGVSDLQRSLKSLGHNPGPVDGQFGRRTQDAVRDFQRSQSLRADGVVGPKTKSALANPRSVETVASPNDSRTTAPNLSRYAPGSREAKALFRDAASLAGVPRSWGNSPALHNILRRESDGQVGRPNYTYGARSRDPSRWGEVHNELRQGRKTARSSATGLGQLLLSNVDRHYPNGRAGIGDPLQEAAGMLSYIKERYGSPERAWAQYGRNHEGY